MTTAQDTFWASVVRGSETECWPWNGYVDAQGYGQVSRGYSSRWAHRVAYELRFGSIPEGMVIDHLCRNRGCVNPSHLEPVTSKENTLRGVGVAAINARRTQCVNGHPFDEENTYIQVGRGRLCKECKKEATRRWRARNQLASDVIRIKRAQYDADIAAAKAAGAAEASETIESLREQKADLLDLIDGEREDHRALAQARERRQKVYVYKGVLDGEPVWVTALDPKRATR